MRRTLLLAAATHALTRKDSEYTYLLGDAVPTSNVDKRQCVTYTANDLEKIDYDVVCQRKYSSGCTWPSKKLPTPGRYCDPVLIQAGCKHCATNSMYNYVKGHPQVTVNIKKPLKLAHLERSDAALTMYRTFFKPQPDPAHTQFAVDVSENILAENVQKLGNIPLNFPHAKVLIHLRKPLDRDMSLVYLTDPDAYHALFVKELASGEFKKRWDKEHNCYANHVAALKKVMGPGKVLIAETQRLFHHRNEVFAEILRFAGIPDFKLDLPKVVSCKAERYKRTYAGCYSGASRVASKTHALFDQLPYARVCRRRLERLVGDVHLFDLNASDWRVRDAPPPPPKRKRRPISAGDKQRERAVNHLVKIGRARADP